ncbi:MAG: hypothetical protein R2744_03240 [Bacteroidales bacterium]
MICRLQNGAGYDDEYLYNYKADADFDSDSLIYLPCSGMSATILTFIDGIEASGTDQEAERDDMKGQSATSCSLVIPVVGEQYSRVALHSEYQ